MSVLASGNGEGSSEKGNLKECKEKEPVKRATHVGKKSEIKTSLGVANFFFLVAMLMHQKGC